MANELATCDILIKAFSDTLILDEDFSEDVRRVAQERDTDDAAIHAAQGEKGRQLKSTPEEVHHYHGVWRENPPRGFVRIADDLKPTFNRRRKDKKRCYITTATCQSLALPDDCDELETLRWFRDNVLLRTPDGAREVEEYYALAPSIVAQIDQRPDARDIYRHLFADSIRPSVEAVKRGDYETAHSLFKEMVVVTRAAFLESRSER